MIFLFIFFKNFVHKTESKFVNKENVTVVKITITINWSKAVGVKESSSTENLGIM